MEDGGQTRGGRGGERRVEVSSSEFLAKRLTLVFCDLSIYICIVCVQSMHSPEGGERGFICQW